MQFTDIIKNENEHIHDAKFEDLNKEERFRQEVFDQIEKFLINQIKKYDEVIQKFLSNIHDFIPRENYRISCSLIRKPNKFLPPIPKSLSEIVIEFF